MREVEAGEIAGFLNCRREHLRQAVERGELQGQVVGELCYLSEPTSRLLAWSARLPARQTTP